MTGIRDHLTSPHPSGTATARSALPSLRAAATRIEPRLVFLYALWAVALFEPQWWIESLGPRFVLKIPTAMYGVVAVLVVHRSPRAWLPPFLALVVLAWLMIPIAFIQGAALLGAKKLLLFYILALATINFVKTPRQATPLIAMLLLFQYLWWAAHGAYAGRVQWHPALANYDHFGALMAVGIPSTIYLGIAAKRAWLRWVAFTAGALCVFGLMSTFARGAVLAAAATLAFAWFRSSRKGLMTLAVLVTAFVVYMVAGKVLVDVERGRATGSFWAEMGTIGNDIDLDEGTGLDRRRLWSNATNVFLRRPLTGVGWNNVGGYAAAHFRFGEAEGQYADPRRLYKGLHSSYFQILAESGLLGISVFLWLLIDFWRRNQTLRSRARKRYWSELEDTLELSQLALGLEAAMVAFLAAAFFYNILFDVWFFALITANAALERVSRPSAYLHINGGGYRRTGHPNRSRGFPPSAELGAHPARVRG